MYTSVVIILLGVLLEAELNFPKFKLESRPESLSQPRELLTPHLLLQMMLLIQKSLVITPFEGEERVTGPLPSFLI